MQDKGDLHTRYCVFHSEGEEQRNEDHQAQRRRGDV